MITVRRFIRIKAFQALFQLSNNPQASIEEAISFAIRYPMMDTEDDLSDLEALKIIFTGDTENEKSIKDSQEYLTSLVNGVVENQELIDAKIESRLEDWSLKRIDSPNLLILRLATYELFFEEISPNIVMNEAIELTKSFNNDKASKFVNGVLQGILDTKEA